MQVIGRFAPSPTGFLHLGSLYTALASYCDARSQGGQWVIRIEDTDVPRNQKGATDAILADLASFGLHSDRPVRMQHHHTDDYQRALDYLAEQGVVYGCNCTRQQLAGHPNYPNRCRSKGLPLEGHAVRVRMPDELVGFTDRLQGAFHQNPAQAQGDCVLRRRDGIWSYQLAVVVDDGLQQITDIVRGYDLIDNTPRQLVLQRYLGLPTPRYAHLPLLTNTQGQKLSKQNKAPPVRELPESRAQLLKHTLALLHQTVPDTDECPRILQSAVGQWSLSALSNQGTV